MKVNLIKIILRKMESSLVWKEQFIKVNGKIICKMERELKLGKIIVITKEHTKTG